MTLRERNKQRAKTEPWNYEPNGKPKQYVPDDSQMKCPRSLPDDKYGTAQEIAKSVAWYIEFIERNNLELNAIQVLRECQSGFWVRGKDIPDIEDAQQIANAVHHYLDWLRACQKRKWDNRPMNPAIRMLEACKKGLIINDATPLHYDEDVRGY